MTPAIIFMILINIIVIGIWLYIFNYIQNLHKFGCKCAEDWRRNAIMYFIAYYILIFLMQMFGILHADTILPIFMTLNFVLTIAFVMIVYHYINDLKMNHCNCSASQARDLLEIINYIQIALLSIILILMVHVIFMINYQSKRMKMKMKK